LQLKLEPLGSKLIANADVLQTISELGAAFAGFSALVTAIAGPGHSEEAAEASMIHVSLGGALIIVVAGLVPLGVGAYSLDDDLVWRFSAAIVLALNYAYIGAYAFWRSGLGGGIPTGRYGGALFWVLEFSFQAPLAACIIGVGPLSSLFLTSLIFLVAEGAYLFFGLVASVTTRLVRG
jgi:hypothetical protein